ncbi:MAG: molybdopterin molybdotransferase MoeA [Pseudomonadota bacterium]
MTTVQQAEQLIADALTDWGDETVPLADAHGRVLRTPLAADRDQPPFDRVMMDGIALRYAEFASGRREFKIQQAQAAGQAATTLQSGEHCIEIMTGAMLPEGCDCVVPVEQVSVSGDVAALRPDTEAVALRFVHPRGSDYRAGDVLLEAGTRLRAVEIAVAASVGAATLNVARLPRIAVVASGDELVDVDEDVQPFQIRRSNDYAVAAALRASGFGGVERFHVADEPGSIERLIGSLLERFDVLVLSGGVSMGKYDYLPGVLESLSVDVRFHRVSQRPGKPMWFGMGAQQQAVFALPGNPVSALTCLHRHVLPALLARSGATPERVTHVKLSKAVTFKPPLTWFLPVELMRDDALLISARPRPTNTSGDFAGLRLSDGFVELPADRDEFPEGFEARYFPW